MHRRLDLQIFPHVKAIVVVHHIRNTNDFIIIFLFLYKHYLQTKDNVLALAWQFTIISLTTAKRALSPMARQRLTAWPRTHMHANFSHAS